MKMFNFLKINFLKLLNFIKSKKNSIFQSNESLYSSTSYYPESYTISNNFSNLDNSIDSSQFKNSISEYSDHITSEYEESSINFEDEDFYHTSEFEEYEDFDSVFFNVNFVEVVNGLFMINNQCRCYYEIVDYERKIFKNVKYCSHYCRHISKIKSKDQLFKFCTSLNMDKYKKTPESTILIEFFQSFNHLTFNQIDDNFDDIILMNKDVIKKKYLSNIKSAYSDITTIEHFCQKILRYFFVQICKNTIFSKSWDNKNFKKNNNFLTEICTNIYEPYNNSKVFEFYNRVFKSGDFDYEMERYDQLLSICDSVFFNFCAEINYSKHYEICQTIDKYGLETRVEKDVYKVYKNRNKEGRGYNKFINICDLPYFVDNEENEKITFNNIKLWDIFRTHEKITLYSSMVCEFYVAISPKKKILNEKEYYELYKLYKEYQEYFCKINKSSIKINFKCKIEILFV